MKTLTFAASAVALGALSLAARADFATDWWSTDFEDVTWNQENDYLTISGAGTFRKESIAEGDADASDILAPNAVWKEGIPAEDNAVLKLDTNGHNLVFTPAELAAGTQRDKTLIDADVYFVGSETEPTLDDSQDAKKIQAAIFLETPEEGAGATSQLKVYTTDSSVGNVWQALDTGNLFTDEQARAGLWLHVQITIAGDNATYKIGAKGADLTNVEGTTLPRAGIGFTTAAVSEVVFRGTGLVDNFTGKAITEQTVSYTYSANITGSELISIDSQTAPSSQSTVTFNVPAGDTEGTALARIKVLDAAGAVARNIAVEIDIDEWTWNLVENETTTTFSLDDGADIVVDVSSFITAERGGVALQAYYGTDPDEGGSETEYYDEGDEAEFTAALNDGFDALPEGTAPVAIDENGFAVTFVAQIEGTYQLVAVDAVDDDFATEGETVATQEAEVGDTVTLVDETAGTDPAKFYKVKLVNGVKAAE